MKLLPLLSLALFSISLFAQPDYCTCMEENREYDELMQYFSSTTAVSVYVPPQQTTIYYQIKEESTEPESFIPLPVDVSNIPNTTQQKREVEKKEMPEKKERVNLQQKKSKGKIKSKIKKKRKRLKGKVKKSRKVKKYKGGCPFF